MLLAQIPALSIVIPQLMQMYAHVSMVGLYARLMFYTCRYGAEADTLLGGWSGLGFDGVLSSVLQWLGRSVWASIPSFRVQSEATAVLNLGVAASPSAESLEILPVDAGMPLGNLRDNDHPNIGEQEQAASTIQKFFRAQLGRRASPATVITS